jgi:chromate transporter
LGATNLIPGPNSTEMAIHIGHARGGWRGLIIAGVCFIVPAALIVGVIAWAYMRYGELPATQGILYGVKPVVIAVVAQALWRLARTAVKGWMLGAIGAVALLATAWGINELLVLLASGTCAALARVAQRRNASGAPSGGIGRGVMVALALSDARPGVSLRAVAGGLGSLGVAAAAAPVSLWTLFAVFAKIGSVLFGSGYVLLAFLRADFVTRLGWLTERQLLDAVAVGQVTPGPVFTSATFVGYLVAGWQGATVATLGIFLPAFVFVALSGPLVPLLRRSPVAGSALDGVNVASLALMAVVSWHLARAAMVDGVTIAVASLALLLLARYRVSSVWLIVGGATLGFLLRR